MHLDGRSRLRLGAASNRLCRWLAVLFPVTIVGSVFGQSYLAPPPGFHGAPGVPSMGNVTPTPGQGNSQVTSQTIDNTGNAANGEPANAQAATTGNPAEATAAPLAAPAEALLGWGLLHVHPHASYQFLYATGIHNQPGSSTDTFTHTIAPGLFIELGPHVNLDYTASIRLYSEKDFHNTVDHALSLNAGCNVGDWTIGLEQVVTITDEPLVETSSQTARSDYNTTLFASYSVNDKISLATTAGMDLQYVNGSVTNAFAGGTNGTPSNLSDTRSYSGSESLNYKFSDHISGGLGVSLSYTEQVGGFRSIEESFTGHLGWHPGTKLTATISGGFEHRSFLDSNASDSWSPICSASVGYQLFEQTSFSVFANRSVDASIFDKQLSENTVVGVGFQQRLLGVVHVSLGFGYHQTDYKSTTTSNLSTSRSDDGMSYSAGATVPFLTHCSFSTFYQYSQNHSSQNGFSYNSSQVGATLSWSY
jgi:hypothetical protein